MNWANKDVSRRKELGALRCFWSMRIYEALRRNGRSAALVAAELGISRVSVSSTILGKNHSPRVLDALRAAGVPERYLFDPRNADAERFVASADDAPCLGQAAHNHF